MIITLHATVTGWLWGSSHEATLRIVRALKRDKPLKQELEKILRDCGDFDGGARAFTDGSYIQITRPSKTKRGWTYTLTKPLSDFPSVLSLIQENLD